MIHYFHLQKKTPFSVQVIIILLPFLLFYWMTPFLSNKILGSDNLRYSFSQQLELLFSLKTGSFPLYVPGFASGHSSTALTLGQIFHPISHSAMIMPGYWDGYAFEWNNFIKLISLGLTQLILFIFLRKIRLSSLFSFLLSFITVYNLRIIDLLRDGANLEAYTGYLILCAIIGWYFISPTKWIGPLCIIGATYLLICSGHPEEMFYGLVGVGLFASVAPYYLSTMLPDRKIDLRIAFGFWRKIGFLLCLGIMLSSVYILSFYFDYMSDNIQRVGTSYAMADIGLDTLAGTINNFVRPLNSDVQGAFGGSFLITMAAIMPVLIFFRIKIPRSIWIIWGLMLFIFLHMQGNRTPIHRLVWQYFPLASSIRVAGRIAIIMPFFMMILLAWIVKEDSTAISLRRFSFTLKPLTILSFIALLIIIIYYLLYAAGYYILSLSIFEELFQPDNIGYFLNMPSVWIEFIVAIFGIASLIALSIYSVRIDSARVISIILIIATVIQLGIILKYRGAHWIEDKHNSISFMEMQRQKELKLDYYFLHDASIQSSTVLTHRTNSFIEPFIGKIYSHIIPVTGRDDAYDKMLQDRLPQQLFIEGYDAEKARMISEGARGMNKGSVELVYSSFNRMQFQVKSQAHAFFGFSYPYTGHWRAWVNDKEVYAYRANGAAHAVEIPEGESVIEFRYWSNAFFWGMLISCSTFAVIGLFVCFRGLNSLPRIIGVIIILSISAGGFMLWYNSLYSGDNLETEYSWTYSPPLKLSNYAYGKKNWLSPHPHRCVNCGPDFSHTLLVDGDRSISAKFPVQELDNPAWFLDLFRNENIKTLLLFESSKDTSANTRHLTVSWIGTRVENLTFKDTSVNRRPLTVAMSNDGSKWRTVASVVSPANHNEPLRIIFDKPETARFIKIEASGKSRLSFNEIEVYGPSEIK